MKVIKLKLTDVFIDPKAQVRKSINQNEVQKYAEQMKEGDKFPNMVVFFDGKRYLLADGSHRYRAYKSNGVLEADFDVHEGGVRDAYLYAVGANNNRGLSMTAEDNRENATRMIKDEEWGKWSDDKIAKTIGIPRSTVNYIRRKLEKAGEVERKSKVKYFDKDGKEFEMDKKKPKDSKSVEENKPQEEPKKDSATEIPAAPEQDDIVAELTNTIDEMSKENEVLKEKIAIGQWDASEIEKIDVQDILVELREKNRLLELENKTLRESRDSYQYQNAELIKTVKSLKAKLKKAGLE